MPILPHDIINFWFNEITPNQWWEKSKSFDDIIKSKFGIVHQAATRCELYAWRETTSGKLAEIILLDQFSRNIYRDTAQAFAHDSLALGLAQTAVADKANLDLNNTQRAFLYMPYMHSESLLIHNLAVSLFSKSGMEDNLKFEIKHKEIIERFGRYPHRNFILGRESSLEEMEFLKTPGSSF